MVRGRWPVWQPRFVIEFVARRMIGTTQAEADKEAQKRLVKLKQLGEKAFDLIDDYLMWIAFRAIQPVFGAAACEVVVWPRTWQRRHLPSVSNSSRAQGR